MSGWKGSSRRARLPSNWPALRRRVFATHGHVCYVCGGYANEVDHVLHGDDHSMANLRPICTRDHRIKSAREGQAARPKRRREPERHPGSTA